MTSFRVPGLGRVDHNRPIRFSFDGKPIEGRSGDTLASALLANGIHLVGRSFKYHRPRGILSCGSEEPNALVGVSRDQARSEPNSRATMVEIYEGLKAISQNRWPSLSWDIGSVNDRLSLFLAAGFYYKTFMWPRSFWDRVYEPLIRRAAGLGKSPDRPDPDNYASRFAHCDVLVVGAGPAGLAAALEAGRSGARVILADEQAEIGGSLLCAPDAEIDGVKAWRWLQSALDELATLENVTILPRTTAIGYYLQNLVGLCQRLTDHLEVPPKDAPRERMWKVRAKRVVLAQGSIEKPLVFEGNDRPGVMLAGSARTYLNQYGVKVGNNLAILTTNDSAWYTAFELAAAGAKIAVVVDLRDSVPEELLGRARALGIEALTGWTAIRTNGGVRVSSVVLKPIAYMQGATARKIRCDALLMSGGWTPSIHLFSHTKGKMEWDEERQMFLPGQQVEACRCAGAGNGRFSLEEALNDGAGAGSAAAGDSGFPGNTPRYRAGGDQHRSGVHIAHLPTDRDPSRIKAFVDFQNDVTAKDIKLAIREGFKSIEHIKRYTTTGMATDQGKTSNINGLAIAAGELQKPAPEVGLTTFRPPYTPTTFGAFAGYNRGKLFQVERKTAIDSWAEENGAVFEPVSLWRRAWYFPNSPAESMAEAVGRECRQTRASLGMFDASTLGKIEIVGPDAAEFMNRMYTNAWTKLAPGRLRYGVLLGEDGYIRDDGVIGRLSQDRFHVTTTTGGAAGVLNMMEDYLQTEWPELQVWLTSTTEHWAVIAVNGPNARYLLEPLIEGIDISGDAFPHMSVAEGSIAGIPLRLFRVSFTGELGFELNIPAKYGRKVWELLCEAGQQYDVVPYGTETMHVLRAEKGYIIVGQETDGTVSPHDAGLSWAVSKKKPDFVGKRSLSRPDLLLDNRKQLVGLLTENPEHVLEEGAQIVADPGCAIPARIIGHVTSSYRSEALGRSIAMALIEGGHQMEERTVYIPMPQQVHAAKVVSTQFFDPENQRVNA